MWSIFLFCYQAQELRQEKKEKYRSTLYYERVLCHLATNQSKSFNWMTSIFKNKYSVITPTDWFCNFTATEMNQWFSLISNVFLLNTTLLKKLTDIIANDSEINIKYYYCIIKQLLLKDPMESRTFW